MHKNPINSRRRAETSGLGKEKIGLRSLGNAVPMFLQSFFCVCPLGVLELLLHSNEVNAMTKATFLLTFHFCKSSAHI